MGFEPLWQDQLAIRLALDFAVEEKAKFKA